jgi:hypothetical protein
VPTRSPSYTTRNAHGIYIFQYRFPKRIRDACPSIQILFRRSLETRSKREAENGARRWWVWMDELNRRLSHDPAAYAKAVELLARYEKIEHLSWAKVEDYLSGLNEDETHLLDVALVARSQNNARKASPDLAEQIALLQQGTSKNLKIVKSTHYKSMR